MYAVLFVSPSMSAAWMKREGFVEYCSLFWLDEIFCKVTHDLFYFTKQICFICKLKFHSDALKSCILNFIANGQIDRCVREDLTFNVVVGDL